MVITAISLALLFAMPSAAAATPKPAVIPGDSVTFSCQHAEIYIQTSSQNGWNEICNDGSHVVVLCGPHSTCKSWIAGYADSGYHFVSWSSGGDAVVAAPTLWYTYVNTWCGGQVCSGVVALNVAK